MYFATIWRRVLLRFQEVEPGSNAGLWDARAHTQPLLHMVATDRQHRSPGALWPRTAAILPLAFMALPWLVLA